MNFYRILKALGTTRIPAPVKMAGAWVMYITGRRVLGVFIDPVLGCNLRCRMCYFSDAAKRSTLHGTMSREQIEAAGKGLFHRAMKLQIGCGAEPTLYNGLEEMVRMGHECGIPYISLTTNGQLIATGRVNINALVQAGLDEITLSMHGTRADTYEYLMPGAKFNNLVRLVEMLREVKHNWPEFKIRVNFTVNSLNMHDLEGNGFLGLWGEEFQPDIVQLRPVQKIGESEWDDFDMAPLTENYAASIGNVTEQCRNRGITCIAPTPEQLLQTASEQTAATAAIEDFAYCYVSPDTCYKPDFLPDDTFESYARRHHFGRHLFASIWQHGGARSRKVSKKLNYHVK